MEPRDNRQIVLRRRPVGMVGPDDTELITAPAPELADGEALARTTYVGIDAAVRTWLDDRPGYLPPVQIGEAIRAAGVGEVVATRCDAYKVGDVVTLSPKAQKMIVIQHNIDVLDRSVVGWLEAGDGGKQVTVRDLPQRDHIDVPVRESLIVELYSK